MRIISPLSSLLLLSSLGHSQQLHYLVDSLPITGNSFGVDAAGLGDLNSDGFDDFVVGAPYTSTPNTNNKRGAIHVYSGVDGSLLFEVMGTKDGGNFGFSLDAAGDANGDGIMDILAGSPAGEPSMPLRVGKAHILSGLDGSTLRTLDGTFPGGLFGWSVAGIGEADGDSVADQVVGEPFSGSTPNTAIRGRARV